MKTIEAHFPEKLRFLSKPASYKVLYGGRGGAKSWGIARQLLIDGVDRPLRTLCARETMNSIADSVHALLEDQIASLNLGGHYEVQKTAIIGRNGSQFAFAGLKHNIGQIKSYEGFDRAWVEEAHNVSRSSWQILIPTIRKEGSEVWVSFNPELATDDTYVRFVLNPPPGSVVVKMSWRDNPWLSDKFMADLNHMKAVNPEEYDHVYEGLCTQTIEGAIYAKEFRLVDQECRICKVPYSPEKPVSTFWDIGDRYTSIWFVQAFPFEYRVIDYLQEEAVAISHYQKELQNRPYVYAAHNLPWDAKMPQLSTGKSIEEQMRSAGFRVNIVPKMGLVDGINAVREMFPRLWFDGERCADGIQGLRHYRWAPEGTLGTEKKQPIHDWASHPADALRYLAVGIKTPQLTDKPPSKPTYYQQRVTAWS